MPAYELDMQELPLFHELTSAEIERFLLSTEAQVKRYGKGTHILEAYQSNEQIGVMVEGVAQVVAEDRFGNETVGHTLHRGDMMGSSSAILPQVRCNTSVEALSNVLVLWVAYRSLLVAGPRLGRIHGIVMKNLLETFCRKNVLMMQKIEVLSKKTLRERLILYLLQQMERQQTKRVEVPGRIQLAKELECNRSALTREIGAMQAAGLLSYGADWMLLHEEKAAEGRRLPNGDAGLS